MDSSRVEKIDQLNRMADLYFTLNRCATDMQMHINYNRRSEMRAVFPYFRQYMIELYYLIRFNDTVRSDKKFCDSMDKWLKSDLQHGVTVKYCIHSLNLFNSFIRKLVQIGIIENCSTQ